jgi:hypothetical protein
MVKAAPLVVAKAEFLLQFLIVALDPPAQLGQINFGRRSPSSGGQNCTPKHSQIEQIAEPGHFRQRGEPVFGWHRFALWPFDQTPFLGSGAGAVVIAMRGPDTHGSKARDEWGVGAFAPGDPTPDSLRQSQRQLLDGNWLVCGVATDCEGGRPRPRQRFGGSGAVPGVRALVEDGTPTA